MIELNKDAKETNNKLRMSLIPYEFLEMSARAFTHGAIKYGEDNIGSYRYGESSTYLDAMLRHMTAIMKGEYWDEDSGVPHCEKVFINAGIYALLLEKEQSTNAYEE